MPHARGSDPEDTGVIEVDDTVAPVARRRPAPPPGPVPPHRWLARENPWPWLVLVAVVVAGILVWAFAVRDDGNPHTVPGVVGLSQRAATSRLTNAGFDVTVVRRPHGGRAGRVFAQRPGGGARLDAGQTVRIDVASGVRRIDRTKPQQVTPTTSTTSRAAARVAIPNVVGQAQPEAAAALDASGLVPNTFPVTSSEPAGNVISQSPPASAKLAPGTVVRLQVSAGANGQPPLVVVPNVVGSTAAAARKELFGASLTVRTTYVRAPDPAHIGVVVAQQPRGGRERAYTQVTLSVGR